MFKAPNAVWHRIENADVPLADLASGLLELRDRLAAAEQRIQALEGAAPIDEAENDRRFRAGLAAIDKATPEQLRAPTPAGGLLELMRCAYESSSGTFLNALDEEELPGPDVEEFTAMLDVIADYLEDRNDHTGARWLREEVERG